MMPRNQETTSVDQAPPAASDPFGARATDPADRGLDAPVPAGAGPDTLPAEGGRATGPDATAAMEGMDATAGADSTVRDRDFAGGTPVRGDGGEGSVPPPEGEWVAGRRDPSATVASEPGQPAEGTRGDLAADTTPAFGQPATGAHAAPTAATPASTGAGLDAAGAVFVTNADGYRASWVRIQSGFVDDPHGSVMEAADLVAQIAGTLVSAVQERERSLRGRWDSGNADTENLRNALRDYRAFFERLMKV